MSRFHYQWPSEDVREIKSNFFCENGRIRYIHGRGGRRSGAPAGTVMRGIPHVYVRGRYIPSAVAAWILAKGNCPAPYVVCKGGDPFDLRVENLQLSESPGVVTPPKRHKRKARKSFSRRAIEKSVAFVATHSQWVAFWSRKRLGVYGTKNEAISAVRRAIAEEDQASE